MSLSQFIPGALSQKHLPQLHFRWVSDVDGFRFDGVGLSHRAIHILADLTHLACVHELLASGDTYLRRPNPSYRGHLHRAIHVSSDLTHHTRTSCVGRYMARPTYPIVRELLASDDA